MAHRARRACAAADAVNIDEGEPGTFKDRWYSSATRIASRGMLIAAWAVDISAIYVYLRDEYHGCRAVLEASWPGWRPIRRYHRCPRSSCAAGAGAYICGEESAMIESIEGKRGMPRLRPPYVAQVGLSDGRRWNTTSRPYWVRELLEKGGAWFASQGRNGREGCAAFGLGARQGSGVKLAPAGITIREFDRRILRRMPDGHGFYGYLPGGASGGILPASMGDIPLDFDTLQPHGCFIGSAAVMCYPHRIRRRTRRAT